MSNHNITRWKKISAAQLKCLDYEVKSTKIGNLKRKNGKEKRF